MIKITPETKILIITPTDQGEERTTIGPCSTCSYEESCDCSTHYNDLTGDYSELKLHQHDFCSNWTDDPVIKAAQTPSEKQVEQVRKEMGKMDTHVTEIEAAYTRHQNIELEFR